MCPLPERAYVVNGIWIPGSVMVFLLRRVEDYLSPVRVY